MTRITNNTSSGKPRDDVWPRINDAGRVVWQGYDGTNWEIWSANSDGTGLVNLSNNAYENESPRINAHGRVVWHAWIDDNNTEILSARCTGGTRLADHDERAARLVSRDQRRRPDRVDGVDRRRRLGGDGRRLDRRKPAQITSNDIPDQYPQIDDAGRIAWQGLDGNDWEIYIYKDGGVFQVSNNDLDDRGPYLRGGALLWTVDNVDGNGLKNSDIQALTFDGTGDVAQDGAPGLLRLLPPRPNPTAGDVRLAFDLPRATDVRLSIYDIGGRERARLASVRMDAGRHELIWNGRSGDGRALPGGVYLARLTALGTTRNERVLLVR